MDQLNLAQISRIDTHKLIDNQRLDTLRTMTTSVSTGGRHVSHYIHRIMSPKTISFHVVHFKMLFVSMSVQVFNLAKLKMILVVHSPALNFIMLQSFVSMCLARMNSG